MIGLAARPLVSKLLDPIGIWLARHGVSANLITLLGSAGAVGCGLWFFPRGQLLAGALIVACFTVFDLLDGALARASGTTKFGAVLDASCDRIVDGTLFAAIAWWCLTGGQDQIAGSAALVNLVAGQVISYIKAKAEASGLSAAGAIAERAERLIFLLVGAGLQGMGVPQALAITLCVLAALSLVTIVQRFLAAARSA